MIDFSTLDEPYLIAEIGINHNSDLQITKKLIDASFACSWNCIKFQKRDPDISVPEHQKNILRETPWGKMTYLEYKRKMEFDKKEYDYIDHYCKEKPIQWSASVWDIPSLEFIKNYDVPFIKIPSAKLTETELLIKTSQTKRPIILSTGMSTIEEIDDAVEVLEKYSSQYVLMHTNSVYPTPINELNIKCIQTLKNKYNCIVGYSGHEYGLEATMFAVALGAKVIERHVTLDHDMWGTDQSSSVEVLGMDILRKRIKNVDIILGDGIKKPTQKEIEIRKKLRGY